MPLTRYLILDDVGSGPRSSIVIGCTKAASNEEALKNAIQYLSVAGWIPNMLRLMRLAEARRTFPRESRDGVFWEKDSRLGIVRKCQLCLWAGRGHHHWNYCPLYRESQ